MSSIVNPPTPPIDRGQVPSRRYIAVMGVAHVTWSLLLLYVLLKAWPPDPWPEKGSPMYFFSKLSWLQFELPSGSLDQRLLFMVMALGALGSLIHSTISFTDYVGNRKFLSSWTWWYLLRPFVGAALALALYFAIRAGFLTNNNSSAAISRFGVGMLAVMSGLFSKQASDKLEEVFTTFFKPAPGKGDAKRGDKLDAISITAITPAKGPAGTKVNITGTGFINNATVTFDGVAAVAVVDSATSITATAPKHAPGSVSVVVKNPDNSEATSQVQFTYTDEATAGAGALSATGFTPTEGPAAGGTVVKITGTGFAANATVKFGDNDAAAVVVESATSIKATTPPHASGAFPVVVKNADGKQATAPSNFRFVQ